MNPSSRSARFLAELTAREETVGGLLSNPVPYLFVGDGVDAVAAGVP